MASKLDNSLKASDLRSFFSSYHEEDNGVIEGTYQLYRIVDETVYYGSFYMKIDCNHLIPEIYLPNNMNEMKKEGFNHFYREGNCCLGTNLDILLKWGNKRNAVDFFDNIVDAYLVNYLSFKETGKPLFGEYGHRGLKDYYCELFNTDKDRLCTIIRRVNHILRLKKVSDSEMCLCSPNRKFNNCDCTGKRAVMIMLKDKSIEKAFLDETRSFKCQTDRKYRKK